MISKVGSLESEIRRIIRESSAPRSSDFRPRSPDFQPSTLNGYLSTLFKPKFKEIVQQHLGIAALNHRSNWIL